MIYLVTTNLRLIERYENLYPICSVNDMLDEISSWKFVGCDTETTGYFDFSNTILTLQLGNKNTQYVIEYNTLTKEDKQNIDNRCLNNDSIIKIFHNASFDIKFLWQHGHTINRVVDTMLCEMILNAGLPEPKGTYTLQKVCMKYTGVMLDKSIRGNISKFGLSNAVIRYAAQDVEFLEDIVKQQHKSIKLFEMANDDWFDIDTVFGLEMRCVFPTASMEYNGITLDVNKWNEITERVKKDLEEITNRINKIICEDPILSEKYCIVYQDLFTPATKRANINLSSPVQKLEMLRLLVPELPDTNERTIKKNKQKHEIFPLLIQYNKTNKLYTSFCKKMLGHINPVTGRIHTQFRQLVSTGRFSSGKPNQQQIPSRSDIGKKMRSAFVSSDGNLFVLGDLSQMELRELAEFSKEPLWKDIIVNNLDIHTELGIISFKDYGVTRETIREKSSINPDISWRDLQKTLSYGIPYGMGAWKLADLLEISTEDAEKMINSLLEGIPLVEKFLQTSSEFARSRGYMISAPPYCRRRFWADYKNKSDLKRQGEISREARNHPLQASNADVVKRALVQIYEHINTSGLQDKIKLILAVHDEIITECSSELAEWWRPIMQELFESAAVNMKTIPCEAECQVATFWDH